MTKNPVLFPYFSRQTMTDLKRTENIFLKDVKKLESDLVRAKAQAEEVRKEINFRTIPETQQLKKDITKLERMIENHNSGKTPLSATKLKNVQKALDATKKAFDTLSCMEETDTPIMPTGVTAMPSDKQDQMKAVTAQDFENAISIAVENMNNRQNSIVRFTKFFYLSVIIAFCLTVCLTVSGPVIGFCTAHYDYFDKETRVPIASLADSSVISGNIHGNFLMTNGYITENPYFYYYSGTDRLKLERVPSSNAFIVRDEEIAPYLLKREHFEVRHTWFTDMGWDKPITRDRWKTTTEYEFHVPKNSIVEPRYNLDTNMNT